MLLPRITLGVVKVLNEQKRSLIELLIIFLQLAQGQALAIIKEITKNLKTVLQVSGSIPYPF